MKDRGLAWELTKMEIRSFTLHYGVKKENKGLLLKYPWSEN